MSVSLMQRRKLCVTFESLFCTCTKRRYIFSFLQQLLLCSSESLLYDIKEQITKKSKAEITIKNNSFIIIQQIYFLLEEIYHFKTNVDKFQHQ